MHYKLCKRDENIRSAAICARTIRRISKPSIMKNYWELYLLIRFFFWFIFAFTFSRWRRPPGIAKFGTRILAALQFQHPEKRCCRLSDRKVRSNTLRILVKAARSIYEASLKRFAVGASSMPCFWSKSRRSIPNEHPELNGNMLNLFFQIKCRSSSAAWNSLFMSEFRTSVWNSAPAQANTPFYIRYRIQISWKNKTKKLSLLPFGIARARSCRSVRDSPAVGEPQ